MQLYQPTITGSLSVSGSINLSGSLTLANGGTISGTSSIATTALTASSADNFLVRNTLTAQTLVVQTITSSVDYVTGSTRFGSLAANTHQFTGSVLVSGSGTFVNSVTAGSKFEALFANTNTFIDSNPYVRLVNTGTSTLNQSVDIVMRFQDGTYNGTGGISMIRESATARSSKLVFQPIDSAGNNVLALTLSSTGAATFTSSVTAGSDIRINNSGTTIPNIGATSAQGALNLFSGATPDYNGGAGISLVSSDRSGTYTRGEIYISAGNASNNTANGFIALSTANTERLRVTYAGNVNINNLVTSNRLSFSAASHGTKVITAGNVSSASFDLNAIFPEATNLTGGNVWGVFGKITIFRGGAAETALFSLCRNGGGSWSSAAYATQTATGANSLSSVTGSGASITFNFNTAIYFIAEITVMAS